MPSPTAILRRRIVISENVPRNVTSVTSGWPVLIHFDAPRSRDTLESRNVLPKDLQILRNLEALCIVEDLDKTDNPVNEQNKILSTILSI